mmetsp:Transcript_26639/g.50052  ORF Transcript_26639/g.50052 Transcript_26639/m.50052 type:complete len:80 (-) Transcript_26639:1171-1410(-)
MRTQGRTCPGTRQGVRLLTILLCMLGKAVQPGYGFVAMAPIFRPNFRVAATIMCFPIGDRCSFGHAEVRSSTIVSSSLP